MAEPDSISFRAEALGDSQRLGEPGVDSGFLSPLPVEQALAKPLTIDDKNGISWWCGYQYRQTTTGRDCRPSKTMQPGSNRSPIACSRG